MSKLKIKSSLSKRFKITAHGHVKAACNNKQHKMTNKSNKFLRNRRGTRILSKIESVKIKKLFGV